MIRDEIHQALQILIYSFGLADENERLHYNRIACERIKAACNRCATACELMEYLVQMQKPAA